MKVLTQPQPNHTTMVHSAVISSHSILSNQTDTCLDKMNCCCVFGGVGEMSIPCGKMGNFKYNGEKCDGNTKKK